MPRLIDNLFDTRRASVLYWAYNYGKAKDDAAVEVPQHDDIEVGNRVVPHYKMAHDAFKVAVDDQVAYYVDNSHVSDVDITMFPNVLPPVSPLFIETVRPAALQDDRVPAKWGWFVDAYRVADVPEKFRPAVALPGAGYGIIATLATLRERPVRCVFYPQATIIVVTDPAGRPLAKKPTFGFMFAVDHEKVSNMAAVTDYATTLLYPILFSLVLMNHEASKAVHQVITPKLEKYRWTKFRAPGLCDYATADTSEAIRHLRFEGQSGINGIFSAMNDCASAFESEAAGTGKIMDSQGNPWLADHIIAAKG